jgi:hypothetical protein
MGADRSRQLRSGDRRPTDGSQPPAGGQPARSRGEGPEPQPSFIEFFGEAAFRGWDGKWKERGRMEWS